MVGIRQAEVQLRAADQQRKTQKDQVDAMLDQAKIAQQAQQAQERLQATVDIAEDRAAVNRERIRNAGRYRCNARDEQGKSAKTPSEQGDQKDLKGSRTLRVLFEKSFKNQKMNLKGLVASMSDKKRCEWSGVADGTK